MRTILKLIGPSLSLCIFYILFVAHAYAQPMQINSGHKTAMAIEFLKPYFQSSSRSGTVISLALRSRLTDVITLEAEMPLAYGSYLYYGSYLNGYYYSERMSDVTFGNFYGGVELKNGSQTSIRLGAFVPTASSGSGAISKVVGGFTDLRRIEAFAADWLILNGIVDFRTKPRNNFFGQIQFGPALWIDTGSEEEYGASRKGTEVLLHYSGHLWHAGEKFNYGGGIIAATVLTEPNLFVSGSTECEFEIEGSINAGKLRPGVSVKLPITNALNNWLKFVLGLNLQIQI
jgi:hypothetical protein